MTVCVHSTARDHWRALSLMLRADAPASTCPVVREPDHEDRLNTCPDCGGLKWYSSAYCIACTGAHHTNPNQHDTEGMEIAWSGQRARYCYACDRLLATARFFCSACAEQLDRLSAEIAARPMTHTEQLIYGRAA